MRTPFLFFIAAFTCAAVWAKSSFDVSKYPQASELVLASLPADVQPLRSVRIKSPSDGLLTLHLSAAGARLAEGTVWGEFDPERLKLEGDVVTLARTLFEEKEKPKLSLELARTANELAERRAEIERQTGMLTRISADPALAELYASETSGTASREEVTALATRLRGQLDLMDEVLRFAGTPRETELERRALELKLQAQELDFKRRLQEFRLAMPFEGELSLIPPAPPEGKPLRVPLGADLALIRDFSAIQARVPIRRPEWRVVDPARLQLRQPNRGHTGLTADYQRSVLQEINGREELLYFFQFPDSQRIAARPLAGGLVTLQLILRLEESARIIPKIDLILAAPDAFREGGWEAGVSAVLPGARLLAQGETHLAVVTP
ncbi:MAG: hypothetical protein WC205_08910 [Opitutaceae bacterium]|jgi:hypothetical protein